MTVVPFGFCEDPLEPGVLAAELTGDTNAAASLANHQEVGGSVSYQVRGYGK